MAEVKLSVNETKLTIISPTSLVATGVNYDTCKFDFGLEWQGYIKTAVFYSDRNIEPIAMLLNENDICNIPWESMEKPGMLYIGVFGIKDNIEIPTNFITIKLVQGAAGNNVPPPPSLSAYKQILDKVAEVKAIEDSFNAAELERKNNEEERQLSYFEFKGDIQTGTGLKNELKSSIATGAELDNKLKEDISLGNTLDLSLKEDISLGDALDLKLKEDIATGNTLKTELEKDITTANTSKENLQSVIETANTTTYATKGEIQEVNAHLAENMQQIDILKPKVDSLASGSPKGVFETVSALQSDVNANTIEGKKSIYIVASDGGWYYWNGTVWVKGGIYQSRKIAPASITQDLLSFTNIIDNIPTNIFNKLTATDGFYIKNNDGVTISPLSDYGYSDYIPVIPGETITFDDSNPSSFIMFYDESKVFIGTINGTGGSTGLAIQKTITVIDGAYFIRFNYDKRIIPKENYKVMAMRGGNLFEMKDLRINKDNITDFQSNISPWTNKTWVVIGDSITDEMTPSIKYHENIKNIIKCTTVNAGFSGSGYMNYLPIYNRIADLPSEADLITVFAGTNDFNGVSTGMTLGTFGDNTPSTFYGCVDLAFRNLIEKYPTKTIAVFTPLPRSDGYQANAKGCQLSDYVDAIKNVARKYSIPVLDLYNDSNFFCTNPTFKTTYCPDGLHPNTAWHVILARKILAFLNTL